MPVRDALARLAEAENANLRWLFGPALESRSQRQDWHECRILQQLEAGGRQTQGWNELIRQCRESLPDEAEATARVAEILNPEAPDFDDKLEDFVAELVCVMYLYAHGHREIHFSGTGAAASADLRSILNARCQAIEVKNLREPTTVTYVAFKRWNANKTREPDRYRFDVQIDSLQDDFELTQPQKKSLEGLIDRLPESAIGHDFTRDLPDGKRVRFVIRAGEGHILHHGGVYGFGEAVHESTQGLVVKLLEPVRKALVQLYLPAENAACQKILFLRWKPPDHVFMDMDNIRDTVRDALQQFLDNFFEELQVIMIHNWEEL